MFKIITGVILSLVIFSVQAECLDDSQNGDGTANLSWVAATQRTDDSDFPPSENGGYKLFYSEENTKQDCIRLITDRKVLSTDFRLYLGKVYNFRLKQLDTEGRESAFTPTVTILIDKVRKLIGAPTYPEFTVTRIGKTFEYLLEADPVTTFENGELLPEGAVRKLFFFDTYAITDTNTRGWVRDVYMDQLPITMSLGKGVHDFTMETEIKVGDQVKASVVSPSHLVNVVPDIVIPNPDVPSSFNITVPEGYDIVIEFVPKAQ